ncbi:MAG: glycosyltransferase family 4 protein [Chitinivibrionales bacterium]|nr:glycosyltransferase family 4 protein [Chitinivibrionales bacterium]
MRICMVAYTNYEGDNRVRRYAEALVKRGDMVDVVALLQPGQQHRATIAGVQVYRIQERRLNEKRKIDYLLKLLIFLVRSAWFLTIRHLRRPYALIHVHSVPDFEVFAAVIPKLLGAKIILDIHDIVPEFFAGKFHAGRRSVLYYALRIMEKLCCAFCDHVIIANDLWRQKLIARSVDPQKCTTMLNYPDPSIFRSDFPAQKNDHFVMMYPGTLGPHQGVDIAIRALARTATGIPQAQLHIYGVGGEELALRRLARQLGQEERVLFLGICPLDEIAGKMACADLGIVPKRADGFGNEAFSTKIFEFMALGVPVLVSNTKVDKFYFNDSVVQFFESGNDADLAEKMIYLAGHADERKRLADNAHKLIQTNNWDVKKQDYFSLVDSLFKASAARQKA